ncbi:glucose-fructose oxidoreductase [Phenylobacterium deserti]|uniref:Glucose-fructose oxidoreductase n=1 Tax=Phenylobacterium deserti TaxID=1914756 RepID=A0A328AZA7_9CAUL|nr:glucose-fructose oxidoreductase [Phenylobacterium deserti]
MGGLPNRAVGRPQPKLEESPPWPEDRKVGFAVVGLGKFAMGQIIPAFGESKAAKLVAVVSGSPEKAQRVAAQHGIGPDGIYDYSNFDRIAQNPKVEVVYVILPNSLHPEFTTRAFQAGKHVLCEKPMANTPEECQRMIDAGRRAGKKLMIAYREQYEPHNLEVMRRIRAGELGDLRVISTDNGRHADPKDPADQWRLQKSLAGGGALPDVGIYGLNAQRYLSGEEPVEVRGWIDSPEGDPRFREVEDVTCWQLRFPSGLIANGSTSYSYQDASRFEILGTKARVTMDPAAEYDGHRVMVKDQKGQQQLAIQEVNQMAREIDHMAKAVRNNTEVKTPGEEGMQDVRLIHAIYESARTGQAVKINWTYKRRIDAAQADKDEQPKPPG